MQRVRRGVSPWRTMYAGKLDAQAEKNDSKKRFPSKHLKDRKEENYSERLPPSLWEYLVSTCGSATIPAPGPKKVNGEVMYVTKRGDNFSVNITVQNQSSNFSPGSYGDVKVANIVAVASRLLDWRLLDHRIAALWLKWMVLYKDAAVREWVSSLERLPKFSDILAEEGRNSWYRYDDFADASDDDTERPVLSDLDEGANDDRHGMPDDGPGPSNSAVDYVLDEDDQRLLEYGMQGQ